ncbi:multicopper oxidase domain-containing protein [Oenococcus oeni]|uniref:multicopper oxidase family protein n=1 Tax=Oenococcus oeni TaxID=1247 RepID=UPI000277B3FF|nr:multicopper oxidase domain-containing protein [Oenococcus oeni]EJO04571.1 putative multicopper oxidase [Oenococcus oeni AWRIB422]EJO06564.1 putative multicopper oxidase [Oenococcus oeni AWRIB548]KEP85390.1 multicopper oxidase [Oenococcus oeni IOEB_0205]KGH56568.1 multicopper oxidase [Oenococcus oeni S22]KGH66898.1 multicopper oxidase [Oenococcus oeni IOEB_B16]
MELIKNYFFDEGAYDYHDGAYKHLIRPKTKTHKLIIPKVLKADKIEGNTTYYTIHAQEGETNILDGKATHTWGYNGSLLGPLIRYQSGRHYHLTLVNDLPEVTTWHWHGLNIPGPIEDGGPHAPVLPGKSREIEFDVNQPTMTAWLHPHPCPHTAEQVWKGLAAPVAVVNPLDDLPQLPHTWGVDDIPLIFQDRTFHDSQWDYQADYDMDGTLGDTALVNGTVNAEFTVTRPCLRLRVLNGANRRELRLNSDQNIVMTQIASDGGFLPHAVEMTKIMLTNAERAEILLDFSDYKKGDRIVLKADDVPILTLKVGEFTEDNRRQLPKTLKQIERDFTGSPSHQVIMEGMDDSVRINGKLYDMTRIDDRQEIGKNEIWDVSNTNDSMPGMGMIHPFHMHGTEFLVLSRNGKKPYPNEFGFKDTVAVNPGEHVKLLVKFNVPGIFMYHCHILEHEDTGMMAQIEAVDPNNPQHWNLKDLCDKNMPDSNMQM